MRYGTDTNTPFDTDNHAWRRFTTTVADDHFDVVTWTRPDDRPVMVTLVDLHTGDTCTLAVLDSLEVRDPHALLTVTAAAELTLHGPAAGATAADGHAAHLALTDPDAAIAIAASRAVPLHHPATTTLPDATWARPGPRRRRHVPAAVDRLRRLQHRGPPRRHPRPVAHHDQPRRTRRGTADAPGSLLCVHCRVELDA
ncbi:hypothetical protein [Dactylosporangium sp. NPDC049140]|uniref:hypothetical protein n=1 Tax=Dactylosporangium sp. NPDC049140 TaxID=3155647 RepID=UPI0034100D82